MFRNILEKIAGVEVYPVISLVLFVLVFTVMLIWTMRRDERYIRELAEMPLNDESSPGRL